MVAIVLKHFVTILIILILPFLSGCSWAINLVVANISNENIIVEYIKPDETGEQFFLTPKTYQYDKGLSTLHRQKIKIEELTTSYETTPEPKILRINLQPGQALHFGVYYSFQDREEIIEKYKLTIKADSATTDGFQHWQNIYTDLLEIK